MRCRICQNETNPETYHVREIVRNTGDPFTFFRCSQCGCLQIEEFPSDMSKYYDGDYYSLQGDPFDRLPPWKQKITLWKEYLSLFWARPVGKVVFRDFFMRKWLTMVPWNRKQRILDIGCGNGYFLRMLQRQGFRHLTGADPFIDKEIHEGTGFRLLKQAIDQVEGEYDVIVMSHSLEHMPDQHLAFQNMRRLLAPNGYLAVMIPMYSAYFLKKYGNFWYSWSIPHHFYLHSEQSFEKLVRENGLLIEKSVPYSFINCLLESEVNLAYLNQDADAEKRVREWTPARWRKELAKLNRAGLSDCHNFLLRRAPSN
ncbi:MAG: class I SAM-dependent methyltransferase [Planctomycetia bacterium]|nr:class I SAM-dependent methyltransferase [Planctomycetia bacterium]